MDETSTPLGPQPNEFKQNSPNESYESSNICGVHLGQVDLNLFVVLEAIYREGNITRAGHQLNLTQPAISHALKRLRNLLRDPLFVRQGTHMVPTPFTRNMIDQVGQALQLLEVNLHESRSFVPENAHRSFHLSLWEYTEALILPSLVQRLLCAAPGMTISTSRVKRRDLEAELARGSVDLAVEIPMTMSDHISGKALLKEPFAVMARKGHPAIKDRLDLDTYLAQHHVQVSSRRHGPSLVDVELSRRGLRRQVFLRIQHNFAASMVVSTTDMLLTLPERQARLLNLVRSIACTPSLSLSHTWKPTCIGTKVWKMIPRTDGCAKRSNNA